MQLTMHEWPSSHVFGFLLEPHNFSGVREALEERCKGLFGPRVNLLDPSNRYVVAGGKRCSVHFGFVANFPGGEYEPGYGH